MDVKRCALLSEKVYCCNEVFCDHPIGGNLQADDGFINDLTGTRIMVYITELSQRTKYIAFRGTALDMGMDIGIKNMRDNLIIALQGLPFAFLSNLTWIKSFVERNRNYRIIFTGHSLGAALAQLFAVQFGKECICFDSPGVQDIVEYRLSYEDVLSENDNEIQRMINSYLSKFHPELVVSSKNIRCALKQVNSKFKVNVFSDPTLTDAINIFDNQERLNSDVHIFNSSPNYVNMINSQLDNSKIYRVKISHSEGSFDAAYLTACASLSVYRVANWISPQKKLTLRERPTPTEVIDNQLSRERRINMINRQLENSFNSLIHGIPLALAPLASSSVFANWISRERTHERLRTNERQPQDEITDLVEIENIIISAILHGINYTAPAVLEFFERRIIYGVYGDEAYGVSIKLWKIFLIIWHFKFRLVKMGILAISFYDDIKWLYRQHSIENIHKSTRNQPFVIKMRRWPTFPNMNESLERIKTFFNSINRGLHTSFFKGGKEGLCERWVNSLDGYEIEGNVDIGQLQRMYMREV